MPSRSGSRRIRTREMTTAGSPFSGETWEILPRKRPWNKENDLIYLKSGRMI
jgi:hypothetical protein